MTATVTDTYFVNAIEGKEHPGGLLVRPYIESDPDDPGAVQVWEAWVPCGQNPGDEHDSLYKSKWYRIAGRGALSDMLEIVKEEHVLVSAPIFR